MADGLTHIDWDAPWLLPLREKGEHLAKQMQQGVSVYQVLNSVGRAPVRFVPQEILPTGEAYESFIYRTQQCPTRNGLHDFFNGLAWLAFSQTKTNLNHIQASEIARLGVHATRGRVRDAATLFDENGAVLQGPPALWQALQDKDWGCLFGELRPLWKRAQLVVFGHALLEKLTLPRKGMTAHIYRGPDQVLPVPDLDAWLALRLSAVRLASKPFAPLPVLGVPGWCADNHLPDFYADQQVFRRATVAPEAAQVYCTTTA